MSDTLTQEQIDAMMSGNVSTEVPEEFKELTKTEKDIIGEVGNISMSQAATTLSSLLNNQVKITTPQVSQLTIEEILGESDFPKIVTSIEFKAGLDGHNMLMIDVPDAIIIADLMMGNDGTNIETEELGELELSAVSEAMNQMVGSASTAMATMFDRPVDIHPPQSEVMEIKDTTDYAGMDGKHAVVAIAFEMTVGDLIKSQIIQLFSYETVKEIKEIMLSDKAETLTNREEKAEQVEEPKPTPQQTPPTPTPQAKNIVEEKQVEKVEVQKPQFEEFTEDLTMEVPRNLDLIMDVPLEFTVVLGKSKRTIKDILSLGSGSVVELNKMTDEPLEILVNGKLIAEGEVVVINESFGIRITNILSKEERIRNINS